MADKEIKHTGKPEEKKVEIDQKIYIEEVKSKTGQGGGVGGYSGGGYIEEGYIGGSNSHTTDEAKTELLFNELSKRIANIESQIKESDTKGKELDKKIENSINKADEKQIKIIETLGIFVALFTFVSIEFQVFKTYQHPLAISGLTLILLGSLLTFITVLDFVLNLDSLSIKKFKRIKGGNESMRKLSRYFSGYTEEIEFSWFSPKTWGDAIKIKTLPLILSWFFFILLGVVLFSCSPELNNPNKEKSQEVINNKIDIDIIKPPNTNNSSSNKNMKNQVKPQIPKLPNSGS